MEGKDAGQEPVVALGNSKLPRRHHIGRPVLGRDRRESRESIEAYDLPVPVERFVDAPQGGEEGEILTPARPELQHHSLHVHYLPE